MRLRNVKRADIQSSKWPSTFLDRGASSEKWDGPMSTLSRAPKILYWIMIRNRNRDRIVHFNKVGIACHGKPIALWSTLTVIRFKEPLQVRSEQRVSFNAALGVGVHMYVVVDRLCRRPFVFTCSCENCPRDFFDSRHILDGLSAAPLSPPKKFRWWSDERRLH